MKINTIKHTNYLFRGILLITIACHAFSDTGYPNEIKDLDIYLLIGQSNMAGRAAIPAELDKIIDHVFLLNDENKWIPARPPLNLYSSVRKDPSIQRLNPGVSFSMNMLTYNSGTPVGLVVNARGGSSINDWYTRESHLYKEALVRIKAASSSGQIKGILWHQGEADYRASDYLHKLSCLIHNFRTDLQLPLLPFIAGQIHGNDLDFNQRILKLPDDVPLTAVARSDGLSAIDLWHYDTQSMITLGHRYAAQMRNVQSYKCIFMEAESKNQSTATPIVRDATASGEYAIWLSRDKTEYGAIPLPKSINANFTMWMLVRSDNEKTSSISFAFDSREVSSITINSSRQYFWRPIVSNKSKLVVDNNSGGQHNFCIWSEDNELRLDAFLLIGQGND